MALPPLFSPSSASPWAGSGPGKDGQGGVAGSVQTLLGCAMLRGRREERRERPQEAVVGRAAVWRLHSVRNCTQAPRPGQWTEAARATESNLPLVTWNLLRDCLCINL